MKRHNAILAGVKRLEGATGSTADQQPASRSGVLPGSIRDLVSTMDRLTAQAQSSVGPRILELECNTIEPSPITDRLPRPESDAALASLTEAIKTAGQLVPILVRDHPAKEGAYQIAFGHRRWKACSALGIPVKAVVRELGDQELLLIQARENLERQNLTFIEMAAFAKKLTATGIPTLHVQEAFGLQRTHLSTMLSVARAIPDRLIDLIGPADTIGRPRWKLMADTIAADPSIVETLYERCQNDNAWQSASSSQRFNMMVDWLHAPTVENDIPDRQDPPEKTVMVNDVIAAKFSTKGNKSSIAIYDTGFASFISIRLATLRDEYLATLPSDAKLTNSFRGG
jgi:ParB family transcriptional regulator, chromosome partitioning protein